MYRFGVRAALAMSNSTIMETEMFKLLPASVLLCSLFTGTGGFADDCTALHIAEIMPPTNPFLVDGPSAMTHWNSAQQDSVVIPGPRGIYKLKPEQIKRIPGGLVNIQHVDAPVYPTGERVIWAANNNRVTKMLVDGETYKLIADLPIPGMQYLGTGEIDQHLNAYDAADGDESKMLEYIGEHHDGYALQHAARAGVYTVMDYAGDFYVVVNNSIFVFGDKERFNPLSVIELKRSYSFPPEVIGELQPGRPDFLFGFNMTFDGKLVVTSMGGAVAVIDRYFKERPQFVRLPGEMISNSFPTDDAGGIYVVTSAYMRKLVWTGTRLSLDEKDGAWQSAYDFEVGTGGVTFSTGSGSTPSLMGFGATEDKLVVITDGMKKMNIVAFWRNEIPTDFEQQPGTKSRRIAGQMRLTFGQPELEVAQSEQSVAVLGYGAFVVNNTPTNTHPDMYTNAVISGQYRQGAKGVQKFEWNPETDQWTSPWANAAVSSPSTVPMVSAGSRQAYVNGFVDGNWEITGIDWDSGEIVTRLIMGESQAYNGAWSLIQLLPDGDIEFGGLFGRIRIDTE